MAITTIVRHIRGRSNKYLALLVDDPTNTRDIYYRAVHYHRRLLSKSYGSFVLTACGSGVFWYQQVVLTTNRLAEEG